MYKHKNKCPLYAYAIIKLQFHWLFLLFDRDSAFVRARFKVDPFVEGGSSSFGWRFRFLLANSGAIDGLSALAVEFLRFSSDLDSIGCGAGLQYMEVRSVTGASSKSESSDAL
jgi:hypothetical protein